MTKNRQLGKQNGIGNKTMDISNNIEIPKITFITPLIQERNNKKRCVCKNRTFIIDIKNREVTCKKCGCIIDPFEAICYIAQKDENYNNYLKSRQQYAIALQNWFRNNRIPIEIKKLVEDYRANASSGALPECPHCGKNFKFSDIKAFSNPLFRTKNWE